MSLLQQPHIKRNTKLLFPPTTTITSVSLVARQTVDVPKVIMLGFEPRLPELLGCLPCFKIWNANHYITRSLVAAARSRRYEPIVRTGQSDGTLCKHEHRHESFWMISSVKADERSR